MLPSINENETPSYRPPPRFPVPFIAEDDGDQLSDFNDRTVSDAERRFQSDQQEAKLRKWITEENPNWANRQNLHDQSDTPWDWYSDTKPESKSRLRSQSNSSSQDEQRSKFRKASHSRDVDIEPKSQQRNVQSNSASSSSQQNRDLNAKESPHSRTSHSRDVVESTEHPISIETPEAGGVDQSLLDQIIKIAPTEGEIQNRVLGRVMSVAEDPARRTALGARVGMNEKSPDHQDHHHSIPTHTDHIIPNWDHM
jgi:hypothetical protein